jgi:hypothetical protein
MEALFSVSAESPAPIRCLTLGAALPTRRPAGVLARMTRRADGSSPYPEAPPCGFRPVIGGLKPHDRSAGPGGSRAEGATVANVANVAGD